MCLQCCLLCSFGEMEAQAPDAFITPCKPVKVKSPGKIPSINITAEFTNGQLYNLECVFVSVSHSFWCFSTETSHSHVDDAVSLLSTRFIFTVNVINKHNNACF